MSLIPVKPTSRQAIWEMVRELRTLLGVENDLYFDEMTDQYVPTPHKCPVCGKYEFEDESCYDICPFCGWEDDVVQLDDPDFSGGANTLSLKQYRKEYRKLV